MENLFAKIYKGKRVLVTGHTGFKGSWLSLWLSRLGAQVIGYSIDIPTKPAHFDLLKLPMTTIWGDILDKKKILETIKKYKPEIVFHLAAQPLVRKSYKNPVNTFETNIMGTVNILESCRTYGKVKAIVNITSDKCYQNSPGRSQRRNTRFSKISEGYKEDDPMGGYDPYSASKGCAELVANAYRNSFFNSEKYGVSHATLLADVRAGNVVGGGDWGADRLIPDIVKGISKNETIIIRNPQAVRPWQHVLECLNGYLHLGWKLLEGKKEFADNWNFGPDDKKLFTVQQIIEKIQKEWPEMKYKVQKDAENYHEAGLLQLNSEKARKKLNWKNVWGMEKGLSKTIKWYKEYYTHGKILSMEDLNEYINDTKNISTI